MMPDRPGYENSTAYAISLALVFTLCVGLLRIWIRRNAYGRDDVVIGAATLLSFGHTGASYAAMTSGLGKPWADVKSQGDLAELNQASMAGIVLFFAALYLSKCAMLAFLGRITKTPSQILLYHICNGAVGLLGLVSIITALAGCQQTSGYYWAFNLNSKSCPNQDARWQAITGLDVITELLLLILPVHLVWGLQMPRLKKAMIIIAFWIRLPALGFSIGRNYYTLQLQHAKSDPGLDSALVTIWLEIELAYAIGASTLSALRAFTESINTGFGLGFTRGKSDSYGLSNVSGNSASSGRSTRTEKAKSISQSQSQNQPPRRHPTTPDTKDPIEPCVSPPTRVHRAGASDEPPLRLRPERGIATYTSVSAGYPHPHNDMSSLWRANSTSVGSDCSGDSMVIVREQNFEVQHDEAPILDRRA